MGSGIPGLAAIAGMAAAPNHPTPAIAGMRWDSCGATFEALVVGSVVANDAMGAPGDTRLQVRPCPNPWSRMGREQHVASLPSDGVIEHRAIIAPRTPPRKRHKGNAEQAEKETEPAHGKGGAPGDTRLLMRP